MLVSAVSSVPRSASRTHRHELLHDVDETAQAEARVHNENQTCAIERALKDNEARAQRLVRTLEMTEDLDAALIKDISNRRRELLAERENLKQRLTQTQEQLDRTPNRELLDLLPTGTIDLEELPEPLARQLFEAFRLEIRYDYRTKVATCRITLTYRTTAIANNAATRAGITGTPTTTSTPAGTRDGLCGAQDETRTRTP